MNTAAVLFKNLCYNNKDNLQAGIIVAGWDKYEGGSVYNIPLGGSLHKQPFAIGGSGSTYIYGYCDSIYRPGMSRGESETFVINGTIKYVCVVILIWQLCLWQCPVTAPLVASFAWLSSQRLVLSARKSSETNSPSSGKAK